MTVNQVEGLGEEDCSRQGELPCEDVASAPTWCVEETAGSLESVQGGE